MHPVDVTSFGKNGFEESISFLPLKNYFTYCYKRFWSVSVNGYFLLTSNLETALEKVFWMLYVLKKNTQHQQQKHPNNRRLSTLNLTFKLFERDQLMLSVWVLRNETVSKESLW